jgi:hypothetical protein
VYRLIYVSLETAPFTDEQLDELLRKSRRANLASGITGLLLYMDGHFMQILEGSKAAVLALIAKIKSDPRHRDLAVLMEGETPNREFKEWSMGLRKLDANPALAPAQFLAKPSKSLALLLSFKDSSL